MDREKKDVDERLMVGIKKIWGDIGRREEKGGEEEGKDKLLKRREGWVKGVVKEVIILIKLKLSWKEEEDKGKEEREIGKKLMKILKVVVRSGLLDMMIDMEKERVDLGIMEWKVKDSSVLIGDRKIIGEEKNVESKDLKIDEEVLGDEMKESEDRDVLENGIEEIEEERRIEGRNIKEEEKIVEEESWKRLELEVLRNDEKRIGGMEERLEKRKERMKVREIILVKKDVGVLEVRKNILRVGEEVRRKVEEVEMNELEELELGLGGIGLLKSDEELVEEIMNRLGDNIEDLGLEVGRDGEKMGKLLRSVDIFGIIKKIRKKLVEREVDEEIKVNRVNERGKGIGELMKDGMKEKGRGSGEVKGSIVGIGRKLEKNMWENVLKIVLKLELIGERKEVIGDERREEGIIDKEIEEIREESEIKRVREDIEEEKNILERSEEEF